MTAAPPRHRSTVRHHRRRRIRRALPEPLDSGPPPPKTGVVEAGLPHYRNHSNWRSPLGTTGGGGSAALPEPLATPDLNPPEQIFRKTQPPMHVHPSPCGPSRERRLVMSPQGLRSLTGTGSAIDPAREGERVKQRKRESDEAEKERERRSQNGRESEARMEERAKPAPSRCPLLSRVSKSIKRQRPR